MIEIKNISKTYKIGDTKINALKNISLQVKKGEFLVIIGPSGSGKTTLMHLIGCLDKPSTGEIKIENKSIKNLNDKELSMFRNQKIGFIFQDFKLHPHLTLLENVKLPLILNKNNKLKTSIIEQKAKKILKEVGLEDRINHKPNEISGGQKQRVAIARALINEPSIILADEPIGDLDSKTGEKIISLLKNLHTQKNLTLIIVTHDMSITKHATKIIEIKDGEIYKDKKSKQII